jgi:hypothetical protein
MNQGRILNPQIVHDVAAYLFWTMSETVGVTGANEAIVKSAGQCLFEQPFTAAVLSQYDIEKLSYNAQRELGRAIAAEAEYFAMKDVNMDGIIYVEDAQNGKSPSAQNVQTGILKAIPRQVSRTGLKIEKKGSLCLRHPLPSVVFSDTRPHGSVFEVADTLAALGFHLPMFLNNVAFQQLGERLFVSKGIFHIPVPNTSHGDLWNKAIQNSTRFVCSVTFFLNAADSTIVDVQW